MKRTTAERQFISRHARQRKRYLLAPKGERLKRLEELRQTMTQELMREVKQ